MKKKALPVMIVMLMCFFMFAYSQADEIRHQKNASSAANLIMEITGKNKSTQANLPDSLEVIEAEAFEGTALSMVELPKTVGKIGDYAFAGIDTLRFFHISGDQISIGTHIFNGSRQVRITGNPKGFAKAWASRNKIPFIPAVSYSAHNPASYAIGWVRQGTEMTSTLPNSKRAEDHRPESSGRMIWELQADKFAEMTAFHIQGRSPPRG